MAVREQVLWQKYRELGKKKLISIDDIHDLMDATEKLLMNYREAVESRDKFKAQIKDLKKEINDFKIRIRGIKKYLIRKGLYFHEIEERNTEEFLNIFKEKK